MKGKKKLALIGLVAVLGLSALGIGINTAMAASDNSTDQASAVVSDNDTDQASPGDPFVSKVAEKLGLDEETVAAAMDQARDEMRLEALEERLQQAVEEGAITQDEAGQILQWEQSRPDALDRLGGPGPGFGPGSEMGRGPREHGAGCRS